MPWLTDPSITNQMQPAPNPLEAYMRFAQLKNMGQEQQLRSAQLQNLQTMAPIQQQQAQADLQQSQQRNQITDQQLKTKQLLTQLAPQFTKAQPDGTPGMDFDGLRNAVLKGGGDPSALDAYQKQRNELVESTAKAGSAVIGQRAAQTKEFYDNIQSVKAFPMGDPRREAQYQQQLMAAHNAGQDVSKWPPQAPDDGTLTQLEMSAGMQGQILSEAKERAEIAKLQRDRPPVDEQVFQDFMAKGGKAADFPAYKAKIEAKATQPYKIQVAMAEAQAKQALEGNVKPVYGIDPTTGTKVLTNQTDAQKKGLLSVPVNDKQVTDDTMLTNRLTDVNQKLQRYEDSSAKPLSTGDKYVMSKILADDKFKAGVFGTELPVDFLNKLDQSRNIGNISKEGQQRLINYYNAREAMQGYQRVLSGSGRSSEQAMQLNLDALPNPIAPEDYTRQSIGAFKENLKIVGQGLPKIPGVKSPEEWQKANPSTRMGDLMGTVKMKAPNGQMKDVSRDQVDHYKSLGATVVQ